MNVNTDSDAKSDQDSSFDSIEEMINSRQQRYKRKESFPDFDKLKIFVRLEKHKETFNFSPKPNSTIDELLEYFYNKNVPKIRSEYPKKKLKVLMSNQIGKAKDYPCNLELF